MSLVLGLLACPAAGGDLAPRGPFESDTQRTRRTAIDRFVQEKWREFGIEPARPCSDAVFLRRVYLDVIGTLPTPDETHRFLIDSNPRKRRKLIDDLLEREEFADYWALKWGDLLRIKSEFPINLWPNAVQAYHRWIRTAISENMPYDRFARTLLTASGSNFRVPPVNFYRAVQSREPRGIAQAVALTFMGSRAENWPAERLDGMAAFFNRVAYKKTQEWKEEIVYIRPAAPSAATPPSEALFPDGRRQPIRPDQDPRQVFAQWLIAPDNPWFCRNMTNRVWYWLLGRGIIHEPDDIRADNRPSNPELLSYLEKELVDSKYDLKHIYRLILNSQTYQLSSIGQSDHPKSEIHFAAHRLRRLEAEVLIDALCQITGTTEEYWSPIPEPFTFIPAEQRSIALADGSITSPFLEMFGRPPRDTGLVSERSNRPTPASRLHLLNSSHIRNKIARSEGLRRLVRSSRNPLDVVTKLYLTILSRFPTSEELATVRAYAQSGEVKRAEILSDVTWALLNTAEFLHRH
jgi:hypothetical protein